MVCAGCKNLDEKKKSDGKNGGSVYYCKKMKKYIRASDEICKKFDKSYTRSTDDYNKMYKEGLNYDNDSMSGSFYLIVGAILLVITLLVYLFNPSMFK